MTPVRVPADTRAIPAHIGNLKLFHRRLVRVFSLVRLASGHQPTTLAMQGLLLELARSNQALQVVAEHYDLPLDEVVRSDIDPLNADLEDMQAFIHPIIEGEPQ